MKKLFAWVLVFFGWVYPAVFAAELYVDQLSPNPHSPHTNWTTAAWDIQTAVDAASAGDTIWVTNGIYTLANQITVADSITIQGVNGPEVTIVDAQQNSRCFELTASGAVLSGLTITNGKVTGFNGGGVYCSSSATIITNCTITGNTASKSGDGTGEGGGVYGGTCYNSTISWNLAWKGGGLMGSSSSDCIIRKNIANGAGGGTHSTTLKQCIIESNEAVFQGGGVYAGSTDSCLIIKNKQNYNTETLTTCGGGGTFGTENLSSTICDNTATDYGGGVHAGFTSAGINNSISCFNNGHSSYDNSYNSSGTGNRTSSPGFVDRNNGDYRLAAGSDCIDTGDNGHADSSSTDLDGLPRIINDFVDIGAYEYTHGPLIETSVDSLTISMLTGTNSYSTNLTVRNIGSDILYYTNYTAMSWLSVSPEISSSTGETDTITVTVDPSALSAGTHPGNIFITANSVNSPYPISVTLTIQPGSLEVSPDTFTLETPFGASPTNRSFTVHNSGSTGVMSYVVSDDAGWLSVSPTNGTCSTETNTVDISFDTVSLAVGFYTGTVFVTSSDVDNSPQAVVVYLEVTAPTIELSASSITTEAPFGGSPLDQRFTVHNSDGSGAMDYTVSNDVLWLSVSPTNGICEGTTNTVTISFDTASLAVGSYTGTISVASAEADNSPQEVTVYLEVVPPSINLSTGLIVVQGSREEPPADQSFTIYNTGNSGAMSYTVSTNESWLSVSPESGTVPEVNPPAFPTGEEITVSFDISALLVGSYTGTISVASADADNSPQEIQVSLTVKAGIIYVSRVGNDLSSGYSWNEAKETIQAGVNALEMSGGTVLVSNGTYYVDSEILINSPLTLQSLSGRDKTIISPQFRSRCLNLEDQTIIVEGFTLERGYTDGSGGAVYCVGITPLLTNCVISSSSADGNGGGVINGTLKNCVITTNVAQISGGGLYNSTIENCEIRGNKSSVNGGGLYGGSALNSSFIENIAVTNGGGMYGGTAWGCLFESNSVSNNGGGTYDCNLKNCTVVTNLAGNTGGGMHGGDVRNSIVYYNDPEDMIDEGSVFYSCSPDLTPGDFRDNITNAPMFFSDDAGAYQLGAASPCIDTGGDSSGLWPLDLIGNPRITKDTVDMGAYEYVSSLDSDGDGMSDWDEIVAGTDPNDPNSLLRILNIEKIPSGWKLEWQGGSNVSQYVDAATDLTLGDWLTIHTNLPPTVITNDLIDVGVTNGNRFYRVRVGGDSL